jgi:hypothetical protein
LSITRTQFANELNIHKSRVTRLVNKGLPTENDGNIKVPDAYHWYQENVLNGEGGNDPRSITTLQAKKLAEEVEIKRLERLHKSGKLVDRSHAEQLAFDFFVSAIYGPFDRRFSGVP